MAFPRNEAGFSDGNKVYLAESFFEVESKTEE